MNTRTDGRKSDYTDRPLTEVERSFASNEKNYKLLFGFMRRNRLNEEEWYDILIIPYLNAVKKYCSNEELQIYAFSTILEKKLSRAVYGYWRSYNTQKNMPKGGFVPLDYTLQGDNPFAEYTSKSLETFWIDRKQQVEKIVLDKEMLSEIMLNLSEVQNKIFEMLLEGYTKKEIGNELCITIRMLQVQLNEMQKVVADCLSM